MKFRKRYFALFLLLIALAVVLVSCNNDTTVEIGEDGYWIINGEKTDVYAKGEKGDTGEAGAQGAQGPQGEKGETGEQGPQGEKGETGEQGPQGATGATGATGAQGAQGIQGEKGDKGDPGEQGEKGDKGDTGAQGEQGIQGEKGDKGDPGEQGEKGDKGDTGAQGEQGIQGEKGDKGDPGEQGEKGDKGDTGAQGEQGIQGEKGDKGDPGAQGEKGDKGDPGATGATGESGTPGRGILRAEIVDGKLILYYTDGTSEDLGGVADVFPDVTKPKLVVVEDSNIMKAYNFYYTGEPITPVYVGEEWLERDVLDALYYVCNVEYTYFRINDSNNYWQNDGWLGEMIGSEPPTEVGNYLVVATFSWKNPDGEIAKVFSAPDTVWCDFRIVQKPTFALPDIELLEEYPFIADMPQGIPDFSSTYLSASYSYKLVDENGAVIADRGPQAPSMAGRYTVTITFYWREGYDRLAKEYLLPEPITKSFTILQAESPFYINISVGNVYQENLMSPLNRCDLAVIEEGMYWEDYIDLYCEIAFRITYAMVDDNGNVLRELGETTPNALGRYAVTVTPYWYDPDSINASNYLLPDVAVGYFSVCEGYGFDVVIANQGQIPYTGSALNVATIVKPEGIGGVRTVIKYAKLDINGNVIGEFTSNKPVDCGNYRATVTFSWQDTTKLGVPCAPITKDFTVVAGELAKQHKNFSAKDSETLFKTTNMSYDPLNDSDLIVGNLPKGVARVATITKYDPDTQTAGAATAVAGKITTADGAGYYKVTITYVEEEGKDNFYDEATLSDTAIVYVRPINKTANKVATNAITVDGEIDTLYGAPVFETKYQAHVTKEKDGKQVFDKIDLTEGKFVNPYEYAALMEISKGANITVDPTNYIHATAKFYAVWDGAYVYIAIEVTDTTPYARTMAYTTKPNPWVNDCVELYYHFGGDNAPKIESGDTYPTYKALVRDSVTGAGGFTAIKSQKSHYFAANYFDPTQPYVECYVQGRDTAGDNTYVIEYKIPAKTETWAGLPGATGDQAFKTIAGENLVAGDFIYLAYQLNDLTGLPGDVSASEYDAQIGMTVIGNKYKDMDYGTTPEKDSPWYDFEMNAAAYIYSAGNRTKASYLQVDGCAPMILALGN